jgi:hypothetical protein
MRWLWVDEVEAGASRETLDCEVWHRYMLRRSDEDVRSMVDNLIHESLDNWSPSSNPLFTLYYPLFSLCSASIQPV